MSKYFGITSSKGEIVIQSKWAIPKLTFNKEKKFSYPHQGTP